MFKYLLIPLILFCFCCKDHSLDKKNDNKRIIAESNKTNKKEQIESKPKWINQTIGSKALLSDFPEFWSYTSVTSNNYDSSIKNEFNLLLEKIEKSNYLNNSENLSDNISYEGNTNFVPYFNSFYNPQNESSNTGFKLVLQFELNKDIMVSLFIRNQENSDMKISKQIDIIVSDNKNNIIDGLNIYLKGNGDQHSYSKYFYIANGIIYLRHFYVYDGESSSSRIFQYQILQSGRVIPYFEQKEGVFRNKLEKGKIKNNTKNGVWIETKYNMYVEEQTYVEASYKEGKPIGKWEYYNIIDETKKGSKILMTEEYSKEGKLLKREITGEN